MTNKKAKTLVYAFRRPKFPLICEIDGYLIGASSPGAFARRLSHVDVAEAENIRLVDARGEGWMLLPKEMIVAPAILPRMWRKVEIIRMFNESRNAAKRGLKYPERVIPNRRLDRIVNEIVSLLS